MTQHKDTKRLKISSAQEIEDSKSTLEGYYRVFHSFGQAKFSYGGLVLGLSQFSLLPHLPQITTLSLKMANFDSKMIISLC